MSALDVVINNADRKGGHVLHGTDGEVYGVDHGICLHSEHKLRTVLWGWWARRCRNDVVEMLERLRLAMDGDLPAALAEHLTRAEIRALRRRIDHFTQTGEFPTPGADYPPSPGPPSSARVVRYEHRVVPNGTASRTVSTASPPVPALVRGPTPARTVRLGVETYDSVSRRYDSCQMRTLWVFAVGGSTRVGGSLLRSARCLAWSDRVRSTVRVTSCAPW